MTREDILKVAKPILFNTEMVIAILEGKKTVTRMVVKPQPPRATHLMCARGQWAWALWEDGDKHWIKAPYDSGDILYVRETFCSIPVYPDGEISYKNMYYYKADGDFRPVGWRGNWQPSIHMPKEAARIFLRVTDVRIERLQDITDEGAKAEGANYHNGKNVGVEEKMSRTAIERFAEIWDSTIKPKDRDKYGWDANPFVWKIEFERVEIEKGE